jgi:uncharacterized protein YciI
MLFAVCFSDNPARADARQRLMSAHLAFLKEHSSVIRAAGPLRDPDSGEGAGGLWLVEAETTEAVRQLYESDPFWLTGLRKSVRVLEWSQVFAAEHRMT